MLLLSELYAHRMPLACEFVGMHHCILTIFEHPAQSVQTTLTIILGFLKSILGSALQAATGAHINLLACIIASLRHPSTQHDTSICSHKHAEVLRPNLPCKLLSFCEHDDSFSVIDVLTLALQSNRGAVVCTG